IPDYRVEPPDVLLVEIAHNVRSPNDPIKTGEDLTIRADLPAETTGAASNPNQTAAGLTGLTDYHLINGFYRVQADGTVDLGPIFGSVRVAGLSLDAARA